MKKLLFLGVGSALIVTMGGVGPAQADAGPHNSSTLVTVAAANIAVGTDRCAACHRAHTSQGADNLVQAQPGLCFNCHGPGATGSSLDVVDGAEMANSGTTFVGALQGGGFSYALIGAASKSMVAGTTAGSLSTTNQTIATLAPGAAGTTTTSSHDISGTTAGTAWGNGTSASGAGAQVTLNCGDCHDPHGNGNFRILVPIPAPAGLTKAAAAVNIPDEPLAVGSTIKNYTTTNYWVSGDATVPDDTSATAAAWVPSAPAAGVSVDGFIQDIASWCTQCHTRLAAGPGSASVNSGDAMYTFRHTGTRNNKEMGNANCITCHVAHGTNVAMSGVNSAAVSIGGDAPGNSYLLRVTNRGMCLMCHNV